MKYRYKYLIIRKKPYNCGETVTQINVSHLNKRGVNAKWDELEKSFPPDEYSGCLIETNEEMREFLNLIS